MLNHSCEIFRILIAQDVEYLRCKHTLTVGAWWRCIIGLKTYGSVVSSLFNLQYGWNCFLK